MSALPYLFLLFKKVSLINENIIFIMMACQVTRCPLGVEGSLTELNLGRLAIALLFSRKSILTRYDVLLT